MALPELLRDLAAEGTQLEVMHPDAGHWLKVENARKLIIASWYRNRMGAHQDKYVVLLDADGKDPGAVLKPFVEELPPRVNGTIGGTPVLPVCAVWHLEAWFFADGGRLRAYLGGKSLGRGGLH